jgi:hypothetical protein
VVTIVVKVHADTVVRDVSHCGTIPDAVSVTSQALGVHRYRTATPANQDEKIHRNFCTMVWVIQVCYFPYPFSLPGLQTFRVFMIQHLLFQDIDVLEADKPS